VRILSHRAGGFRAVAYVGRGQKLVSFHHDGHGHDRWLRLWDLASFRLEGERPATDDPSPLLFLPGGVAFLRRQRRWDEEADIPLGLLPGQPATHPLPALAERGRRALAFTPDGRGIVHSDWQKAMARRGSFRLILCDDRGNLLREFSCNVTSFFRQAAFTPDGRLLAAHGESRQVFLWDAAGAAMGELEHSDVVIRLAFAPDGRLLATAAGRTVRLWDVAGRECLYRFPAFRSFCEALAFSPDGRLLAAGSNDCRLRVWDTASGRELADLNWEIGEVRGIAFAPDGATAAAVGSKKKIAVWDVDL